MALVVSGATFYNIHEWLKKQKLKGAGLVFETRPLAHVAILPQPRLDVPQTPRFIGSQVEQ